MEMKNDCVETFSPELILPKPISGLNIWPPGNPNVTTRDIYDINNPIGYDEITNDHLDERMKYHVLQSANRGPRRGTFVVNPEWLSEDTNHPPKTVRQIGRVYEPSPIDFFGARDLHAKTWEQASIYPGHGVNPHHAIPGYAPYKHVPIDYRSAREDIGKSWPWDQTQSLLDWKEPTRHQRPNTASGAYHTQISSNPSSWEEQLNALHDTHVKDRMEGGKPDIETRLFTRSNREILFGWERKLNSNPYGSEQALMLPHPYAVGGHRELTDLFASTYSRNLPQMSFRRAQHAHAPWHAYMTFCDWGETPTSVAQSVA